MMNNLNDEIQAAIEWREDEWRPLYICAYGTDRAVVIWEDLSRDEFTMQWATVGGEQLPWNGHSESPDFAPETDVECAHVNDEVCETSLENAVQTLADIAELW
jgi:hypothetical protein